MVFFLANEDRGSVKHEAKPSLSIIVPIDSYFAWKKARPLDPHSVGKGKTRKTFGPRFKPPRSLITWSIFSTL